MFEGKTCHGFTFVFGLLYLRHLFKTGNHLYKFVMACLYPLVFFHASYNFGRHLGFFMICPSKYYFLKKKYLTHFLI